MSNFDEIDITILDDGTVKSSNDTISASNHQSADKFVADLARNMGGETVVKKKGKTGHVHNHGKVHEGHSH